jgi:hypothetical protein
VGSNASSPENPALPSVSVPLSERASRYPTGGEAALWLLPGLVVVGSVALFGSGGGDDSHITWWVVDTFKKTGKILNLNGDAIEQSSSLGLVVIAAALKFIFQFKTPAFGVLLSLLATAMTCLMGAKLARRFAPRLALPCAWLIATSGPLVYWGTSGMETSLAALAALWLLDAIADCADLCDDLDGTWPRQRLALFKLFCATSLFITIRPENHLLVLGVFGGGILCSLHTFGLWPVQAARLRFVGLCALAVVLPIVLLFGWRYAIFHAWFPHPVTAKAGSNARWAEGWKYLARSTTDFQPAMFLLLPAAVGVALAASLTRRTKPVVGFAVSLAVIGVVFICASGGDWMSCGRFLANQLPVWWVVVIAALSLVPSNGLRTVVWTTAACGVVNLWFLIGLARSGGANGYPLSAALKVVPAAREQYQLQNYSFLELANKSHLRDTLLAEELKRVVAKVTADSPDKIWIASGQAGGVPYHTFRAFPGRLHFIDYWGLIDAAAMPCIPPSSLKHSSLGVALSPELMFKHREAILRDCGVPMPHIVFNTNLHAGTRKGLEARGYRVVYFQRGKMPSFSEPGLLRGGTAMDAYIAVQRDLADRLQLEYHEVRWTIAG